MSKTVIVVPCFNEAERLRPDGFDPLLRLTGVSILFVNDGSTDGTLARLEAFRAEHPETVQVLDLKVNSGKGEAVRRGMLHALDAGADITGYLDADLATPAQEFARLLQVLNQSSLDLRILIGARVRLLGRDIQRSPSRHILGRVFATVASTILGVPVYDTQCGAKLFRRNPTLESALSRPFSSRWVFDVELIGRLVLGCPSPGESITPTIMEEPLLVWRDIKGSKLGVTAMVRAAFDLLRIKWALQSWTR